MFKQQKSAVTSATLIALFIMVLVALTACAQDAPDIVADEATIAPPAVEPTADIAPLPAEEQLFTRDWHWVGTVQHGVVVEVPHTAWPSYLSFGSMALNGESVLVGQNRCGEIIGRYTVTPSAAPDVADQITISDIEQTSSDCDPVLGIQATLPWEKALISQHHYYQVVDEFLFMGPLVFTAGAPESDFPHGRYDPAALVPLLTKLRQYVQLEQIRRSPLTRTPEQFNSWELTFRFENGEPLTMRVWVFDEGMDTAAAIAARPLPTDMETPTAIAHGRYALIWDAAEPQTADLPQFLPTLEATTRLERAFEPLAPIITDGLPASLTLENFQIEGLEGEETLTLVLEGDEAAVSSEALWPFVEAQPDFIASINELPGFSIDYLSLIVVDELRHVLIESSFEVATQVTRSSTRDAIRPLEQPPLAQTYSDLGVTLSVMEVITQPETAVRLEVAVDPRWTLSRSAIPHTSLKIGPEVNSILTDQDGRSYGQRGSSGAGLVLQADGTALYEDTLLNFDPLSENLTQLTLTTTVGFWKFSGDRPLVFDLSNREDGDQWELDETFQMGLLPIHFNRAQINGNYLQLFSDSYTAEGLRLECIYAIVDPLLQGSGEYASMDCGSFNASGQMVRILLTDEMPDELPVYLLADVVLDEVFELTWEMPVNEATAVHPDPVYPILDALPLSSLTLETFGSSSGDGESTLRWRFRAPSLAEAEADLATLKAAREGLVAEINRFFEPPVRYVDITIVDPAGTQLIDSVLDVQTGEDRWTVLEAETAAPPLAVQSQQGITLTIPQVAGPSFTSIFVAAELDETWGLLSDLPPYTVPPQGVKMYTLNYPQLTNQNGEAAERVSGSGGQISFTGSQAFSESELSFRNVPEGTTAWRLLVQLEVMEVRGDRPLTLDISGREAGDQWAIDETVNIGRLPIRFTTAALDDTGRQIQLFADGYTADGLELVCLYTIPTAEADGPTAYGHGDCHSFKEEAFAFMTLAEAAEGDEVTLYFRGTVLVQEPFELSWEVEE